MCYLLTKRFRLIPKPWYYPKRCKKSDRHLSPFSLGSLPRGTLASVDAHALGRYVDGTSRPHLHTHTYSLLPDDLHQPEVWLSLATPAEGTSLAWCAHPTLTQRQIQRHQSREPRGMREFWGEGQWKPRGLREAEGWGTMTWVQRSRGRNRQHRVPGNSKKGKELWGRLWRGGCEVKEGPGSHP